MHTLLNKLRRSLRGPWLIPVLLFASVACGGSSDNDPEPTAAASAVSQSDGSTATAANCPAVPFAVHLRSARGANVGNDDQSFEVTSAKGVIMAGGAGYSLYLANFELDDAVVGGLTPPVAPEGRTLITIFLTTFNAQGVPATVKEGDVIPHTSESNKLTFRVVSQVGNQSYNSAAAAQGTFTVTATGDQICGEIDYSDSATADLTAVQNILKGTIAATIVN